MALGETTTDDEGNNSTKPEVKEEDATKKGKFFKIIDSLVNLQKS